MASDEEEAKTAKAKSTASDHPQTIVPQPPQKTAKKKVSVVRTKPPLPEFIDDLDQCLRKFVIKLNNCPR